MVKKLMGCNTFDWACRAAITHYNPGLKNPFDPSYTGTLTLPSLGVKAAVPRLEELQQPVSAPTPAQRAAGGASQAVQKKAMDLEREKIDRERLLHKTYRSGKEADGGLATQSIQKNIPSQSPYRIESAHVKDFHYKTHQEDLFRQISHPLYEGPLSPQVFKTKVVVAIFDGWVDPTHCEFNGAGPEHRFNNRSQTAPGAPSDPTCSAPVVDQGSPADHGTHVAGLIAARINDIGIVGMNPLAHMVTFEADGLPPLSLVRKVGEVADEARIINISMTNTAVGNDPLLDRIRDLEQTALFVVAAGNQGWRADNKCDFYPACYHARPNVLTVVALDNDAQAPRVWRESDQKGSNYGTVFHLGVPASGIVSSLAGGRYGRLTGSSQAAPIVTGAASLFYMKYPLTPPGRVKERLIYTSDLFDSLQDQLFGGRLNVRRALDADTDLIVLRSGEILHGDVKKESRIFFYTPFSEDDEQKVVLKYVKRLVRRSDGAQPFTLINVRKKDDGVRSLERHFYVKLPDNASLDIVVRLDGVGRRPRTVRLDEVADFTAALSEE